MNQRECADLIRAAAILWPTVPHITKVDATMLRLWALALSDIAAADAEAMLVHCSRQGDRFPPTPGVLARLVLDARSTGSAPGADEAWAEVSAAVTRRGWYAGMPEWSHPAVEAAARAIGWDELCHGDVMVVRAHFVKLYTPAADRTGHAARLDETMTMLGAAIGNPGALGPGSPA